MEIAAGNGGMVFIAPNTTVVGAIDSVDAHCKLPTPWLVRTTARIAQRVSPRQIQSGWYMFQSADTQLDVLRALFTGARRPTTKVVLQEGLTKWEVAGKLGRALDVDSTVLLAVVDTLEGRLFPDTYEFFWREEPLSVVNKLVRQFNRKTAANPPTREELILASIIQAEAASVSEMPTIAGVYKNRLDIGKHLEADPTVQYGLRMRSRLTYQHLADTHQWNTYQHAGLPPTPICNPGMAAIRAAQQPAKHHYLYFVAMGDGSGKHRFAASYNEHLRNVALYRKAQRSASQN